MAENKPLVLFGAGTTGRTVQRRLQAGGQSALCFVDNDAAKQGTTMEGIPVLSPASAFQKYPDPSTLWVASVMRPEYKEILVQMKEMGVARTETVWRCFREGRAAPPPHTI